MKITILLILLNYCSIACAQNYTSSVHTEFNVFKPKKTVFRKRDTTVSIGKSFYRYTFTKKLVRWSYNENGKLINKHTLNPYSGTKYTLKSMEIEYD